VEEVTEVTEVKWVDYTLIDIPRTNAHSNIARPAKSCTAREIESEVTRSMGGAELGKSLETQEEYMDGSSCCVLARPTVNNNIAWSLSLL
jgi:hypothetical protein